MATKGVEVEIKLAIQDAPATRRALCRLGFTPVGREREHDILVDTADLALRRKGCLLRLRHHGRHWMLTFKGPADANSPYKIRLEIETAVAGGQKLLLMLEQLGYRPVFIYEKVRTSFRQGSRGAVASLDVTPIGTYLELEGSRPWIDRTARALGFSPADYINLSYAGLYVEYCRARGLEPANMVFSK